MSASASPRFDFTRRDSVHREELRAAPSAEVHDAVRALFDKTEAARSPDFDQLMKVGLLLQENPTGCDVVAVAWLGAKFSAKRLDIVGALLCGLWLPSPKLAAPRRDIVRALVALRPAERTEPDGDYSYALALMRVLDNPRSEPDVAETAWLELERAAARGTGDASLDRSLFESRKRFRRQRSTAATPGEAPSGYRAYALTGDAQAQFVVERTDTHAHVVEVHDLSEKPGELMIAYRKSDPAFSNVLAVDLLESELLRNLLESKHRERVQRVIYVDEQSRFKVEGDYPT
jgi:hypothetical protein